MQHATRLQASCHIPDMVCKHHGADGDLRPNLRLRRTSTPIFEEPSHLRRTSPIFEEPPLIFVLRPRRSKNPSPSSIFGAEDRRTPPHLRSSAPKNGSKIEQKRGGVGLLRRWGRFFDLPGPKNEKVPPIFNLLGPKNEEFLCSRFRRNACSRRCLRCPGGQQGRFDLWAYRPVAVLSYVVLPSPAAPLCAAPPQPAHGTFGVWNRQVKDINCPVYFCANTTTQTYFS